VLGALFLDGDHYEPVGFADDAPASRALRLVARSDDPKLGRAVVNLVLLGPCHLDNRGAVLRAALAPARATRVEAVLSRRVAGHARNLAECARGPNRGRWLDTIGAMPDAETVRNAIGDNAEAQAARLIAFSAGATRMCAKCRRSEMRHDANGTSFGRPQKREP
jgi:hypothetical protein